MIKVRVTLPLGFKRDMLDERNWMELPDDSKLSDALKTVRISKILARTMFVCVNGALSKTNTVLNDGDSVSFFPIPFGG
jgi:molybdopterin converting factor small subunit